MRNFDITRRKAAVTGIDAKNALDAKQQQIADEAATQKRNAALADQNAEAAAEAAKQATQVKANEVYGELQELEPQLRDLEEFLKDAQKVVRHEGYDHYDDVARIPLENLAGGDNYRTNQLDLRPEGIELTVHVHDNVYPSEGPIQQTTFKPLHIFGRGAVTEANPLFAEVDVTDVKQKIAEARTKLAEVVDTGKVPSDWIGHQEFPGGGD